MLNLLKIQLTGSLLCLSLQVLMAQTFENSIGNSAKNEYTYDGKPLSIPKGFATISNSPVFSNTNQWLFTRLSTNGNPTLNKVYGESNDIVKNHLEGRAIERATRDSKLVYQAGARTHAQPVRAVLMLSNDNGTPLHALQQYSPDNSGEMATALESTSDGVIVAGNAQYKKLQTNNRRFFAARFKVSNNKLTKIWSFRYFDTDSTKANFTIGKTCLGSTANGVPVLLITGSYLKNERHSFVSCINVNNGVEMWRTYVESGFRTDEGADIIQDPATRNFMMVGYCINTAGKRCLYVAFLNQAGTYLTSASYATVFDNSEIVGQDVTLSNNQKNGVITGFVRLPENNLQPKAFFVEIPLALLPGGVPANPTQIKYYSASEPFMKVTSSIDRNDNANNTRGYFIATQSTVSNGRSINYDIHVIDVENDGETRLQSCPVKRFELRPERRGRGKKANMGKEPTKWGDIQIIEKTINLPVKRCD